MDRKHVEAARMFRLARRTDPAEVAGGVSVNWLALVFHLGQTKVKQLLEGVQPVRRVGHLAYYDVATAARYLVPPNVDSPAFIRALREKDLPVRLQKAFWDSQRAREKWLKDARDLWHTDDVLDTFSEGAKTIRDTVLTWVDNIDRHTGLTPQQMEALQGQVDALLAEIHEQFVAAPARFSGRPVSAEEEELIRAVERAEGRAGESANAEALERIAREKRKAEKRRQKAIRRAV